MGGLGSGAWKTQRRKAVDDCLLLDADYLAAKGCLRPGCSSTGQWLSGNEVTSIEMYAELDRLHLSYALRAGTGERENVVETIPLDRRPRHFGGLRAYFLCPGNTAAGCGRRLTKLFLAHRLFLCRHCNQIAYASQYEQPWQRAFRRANKLRQRLHIAGIAAPLPRIPRGMSADTYARRLEELLQAETLATEACADRLQWFVDRIEKAHPSR